MISAEDFENRIGKIFLGNAKLISKFTGLKDNVSLKFINCGHEHTAKAQNFLYKKNSGCNVCNKNDKKTNEQFCKEVYKLVGDEYTVMTEYSGNKTHLIIKHNFCNNEYSVAPSDFLSGKRCPKCQHRSYKKTTEEFKLEIFELVGNEYEVLEEYINAHEKILFKHNICDNIYPVKPSKFLSGRRCPICMPKVISEKQIKSHEEFCKNIDNLVGSEYEVISKYSGANKYIDIKHNICGSIYSVKANNFLTGRRCPICAESKGEQLIRKYFENNKIDFISQKEFEGLVGLGGGNLSYDFYLPKYNILIEYQGEFHDGNVRNQTKKQLKKQQEHDYRKREYTKQNGYKLLEIWYWDFDNIEEILESYLN